MCEPVAQDYFSTERGDDPGIGADDRLLRNCRLPVQIAPCAINGFVISDQVFAKKKSDAGTSVDLECLVIKDNKTWADRYGFQPGTLAMVAVTAAQARAVSEGVAWTPKPEQPELAPLAAAAANPYHGEIIGITRSKSRELRRCMQVLRTEF